MSQMKVAAIKMSKMIAVAELKAKVKGFIGMYQNHIKLKKNDTALTMNMLIGDDKLST